MNCSCCRCGFLSGVSLLDCRRLHLDPRHHAGESAHLLTALLRQILLRALRTDRRKPPPVWVTVGFGIVLLAGSAILASQKALLAPHESFAPLPPCSYSSHALETTTAAVYDKTRPSNSLRRPVSLSPANRRRKNMGSRPHLHYLPRPCPAWLSERQVRKPQSSMPDVQLVSLPVDPEHDTPAILGAIRRRYQAQPDRWHFLTGPRENPQPPRARLRSN